jgi:hypothetical protein
MTVDQLKRMVKKSRARRQNARPNDNDKDKEFARRFARAVHFEKYVSGK